jgi:transcriptional regulator with PAS, ATPase and Fis domain
MPHIPPHTVTAVKVADKTAGPPLRDRPEDIPMLVRRFVDEFSRAMGKSIESIAQEDLAALQRYDWPGNVRELRNVIERSVIVSNRRRLTIEVPRAAIKRSTSGIRLADVEREHMRAVLRTPSTIRVPCC